MKADQKKLTSLLKSNHIFRVYYLFGEDVYYVSAFAKRIAKLCEVERDDPFNYRRFEANPPPKKLSDNAQTLPVFAARRIVELNDLDIEKYDDSAFENLCEALTNLPDSAVVLITMTGGKPDRTRAKTKKFLAQLEKDNDAVICEFKKANSAAIAESLLKKYSAIINRADAQYLAEITGCDTLQIRSEMAKLTAYGGVINREIIDRLVVPQIKTAVFAMADALNAKDADKAFALLNDMRDYSSSTAEVLAALSSAYIAVYHVKLAMEAGHIPDLEADFGYSAWRVNSAIALARGSDLPYLRRCVLLLAQTDFRMKSSPVSDWVVLEQTMARLLTA
jgi:DNA polymerase III delta subunit